MASQPTPLAPLINDNDFYLVMAANFGLTQLIVQNLVNAYHAKIIKELKKGNRIKTSIGVYEVKHTLAYTGQNPRTNLPIPVAASNRVLFTANQSLKDGIN